MLRTWTAEEYAAHQYHLRVGAALVAWAWAMRQCLPTWRVPPVPGEWDIRPRCVDEFRPWWRTGRRNDR